MERLERLQRVNMSNGKWQLAPSKWALVRKRTLSIGSGAEGIPKRHVKRRMKPSRWCVSELKKIRNMLMLVHGDASLKSNSFLFQLGACIVYENRCDMIIFGRLVDEVSRIVLNILKLIKTMFWRTRKSNAAALQNFSV